MATILEESGFNPDQKLKIVGTNPVKHDGPDKVTGKAKFGADLFLPGMLMGKILRSPHPHAIIKAIDTSKAEALPGVKSVVTAADFPELPLGSLGGDMTRNIMARERVFYDGHPIAAVAATSEPIARRALKLIEVDYEVLPHVIDPVEAMKPDAPILHEDQFTKGSDPASGKPSNIALRLESKIGDVEEGFKRADVIIEAIFENAQAKRELFRAIEPKIKPDAILASNTSAIPLDELASALEKPARLIGLHFFNPVAKMPLVEVVYDKNTDPGEVERGSAFCGQINRFPLPVKSSPGFLVNRVLSPYMLKALQVHRKRKVPMEALDQAATEFGMPMGPVELADTVGLDVGLNVMEMLGGEDAAEEAALLKSYVEEGKLGKKSGEGFYQWKKGKPVKDDQASAGINLQSLGEELMAPYFEACQACLEDGIVADSDVLDAGMIFGTGFAPFRGGPMFYLEQQDQEEMNDE